MVLLKNDYFKIKPSALVFFITFFIYSPLLFNNFVGDDITFIAGNTFYSSWKNIPRLVEKGYISDPRKINLSTGPSDFGSGSYSYRPLTSLTFFLDHYIFRDKPYGSHLINNLIHGINAVLVYWIVNQIFSSSILGVFAGLLFSLHPIQSEAVANLSCRFDLLAAMFALFSFYFWIKFKQGGLVRRGYYCRSLAMYFLALFSKESALMLPLVVLFFDQVLATERISLRQRGIYYLGFILIAILYLYLYLVVFPNSFITLHWLGGTFLSHCLIMGFIWYNYLINILLPWTVKVIPGLYCPPAPAVFSLITAEIATAFIILITSIFVLRRNYKECLFFLIWYIIFYLPVSDMIPVANPMADRFMYLPSIGLLIVLAFFLHKVFNSDFLRKYSQLLPVMLGGAVIMICVMRTLFINDDWKSNFNVGWAYVRDYPAYGRGYALLGSEYFNAGYYEKARGYMEKSVLLGDKMPREVFALAKCYIQLGEIKAAEALLKQIILNNPDYDEPYLCLGEIYYDRKNYSQAQGMLEKALKLNPKNPYGRMILMKVYLNLHRFKAMKDEASEI